MKILYWTSNYWPAIGGIEVLSLATLPALQARGYEVRVVAAQGQTPMPAQCEQNGIPVYRFPFLLSLARRDLAAQSAIRRAISDLKLTWKPDLVHLNFVDASAFFHQRTQRVHPCPLLFAAHSDYSAFDAGADTLLGACLNSADWICAVSRSTLTDVLTLAPEIESRASVIANGLPAPPWAPSPLRFEPPHIVCYGRLVRDKGFDIALRAFALLLERAPGARLSVAGEGEERAGLEALARSLNIAANVCFTGRLERDEVFALLDRATLVVVPSRYREPFGLVALEAAQMARPVVAARMGGLTDTVAEGQSGLLVDNENVQAFADAMRWLIEHPEHARTMGAFGRKRALEEFNLDACVDAYDALYQKLRR